MIKEAAFFGGAIRDTTTKEYKDSILIGALLAKRGYVVVNGGYGGLMEAVSKGAFESGGKVYGITCASFGNSMGNKYLTNEFRRKNIYNRLEFLIDKIKIFIVQKGGIGTLSELFLAWDVNRKTKSKTRIYLIGEHWNAILTSLEPVVSKKEISMIVLCKDYKEFEQKLEL